jgi:hypothetical protein
MAQGPFKMKGSPIQRNFGKELKEEEPIILKNLKSKNLKSKNLKSKNLKKIAKKALTAAIISGSMGIRSKKKKKE